MEVFTMLGLVIGAISAFFMATVRDESPPPIRRDFRVVQRPSRSRSSRSSASASKRRATSSPTMRAHRIQGEVCWRTGMPTKDCPCGSCRS